VIRVICRRAMNAGMRKRATLIKRDCHQRLRVHGTRGTYEDRLGRASKRHRLRPAIIDFVGRNAECPVKQKYDYQPLCERPSALPIRGGGGHLLLGA